MAARKTAAPTANKTNNTPPPPVTLASILTTLQEMGAHTTSANQVSMGKVAERMSTTIHNIMRVLDTEDLEGNYVDGDRGYLYATGEPLTAVAAPVKPARKATTRKPSTPVVAPVQAAVTPVLDSAGEPITVPVSENSTERRELDASKGERVISEDDMRDVVKSLKGEKNMTAETTWTETVHETHFTEHTPGTAPTGHTWLTEEDVTEAPPVGVNENFWVLYKSARTAPARVFWGKKVAEQIKTEAMKELESKQSPAPVTTPVVVYTDPVTGEVIPF